MFAMENDEIDFVASEHDRLVSAITKLDKTQHISQPTRNEPINLNSEFNLIKKSKKLKLNNIVKVLDDTANSIRIGKKLKKSHNVDKILPKPLEKPQSERIKRATGYAETKKKVGRWDPVVARNRTVDFVSFPIKQYSSKLQPTQDFLSKLKLKSQLEKELEEIDPPPEQENIEEEEQVYPMSYEEMLEHRQHSAKLRAQQSYKAAKAKRQSKIKSKKYHRILKKERLKQQLKEFEELQNKNPEEALKKLEELEKARSLERHTLRHKNTGKWAKSKLVRAKYDKEVRQQLAEQLAVSRTLTHKVQDTESSGDDENNMENIPDITLIQNPLNPWMMKKCDGSNVDTEFNFGYKKYVKDKMYKNQENYSNSEEENAKDQDEITDSSLKFLKESVKKISIINNVRPSASDKNTEGTTEGSNVTGQQKYSDQQIQPIKMKTNKISVNTLTSTSNWAVEETDTSKTVDAILSQDISTVFDKYEDKVVEKVEKKLKQLRKKINKLSRKENKRNKQVHETKEEEDNLAYLKLNKQNPKPIIDEELLETHKDVDSVKYEKEPSVITLVSPKETLPQENKQLDIDPNRFIEVKPKYLNTAISKGENDYDVLDDEEQVVPKVDIEEVFEEDDVVASFRQEKDEEINKDTPKDIDLTLPGWGTWGGKGVKAPKRRKNRFISRAAPKVPRRDENKGDIIINELKNPKLTSHKVSELPFPFNSVKEYEASIRLPLGNTFIPETAHKKLIRPNVITKAGAIIEPIDEDELLVKRNRSFKNDAIIKLLSSK